jgi:hypothetical protein
MPFRPCCSRVGPLPDPDLCCPCVGRSSPVSRRACTPDPAPAHRHARPRPEDRLPRGYPLGRQPARYPAARPGMTHREGQSMHRRTQSSHIADSVVGGSREHGWKSARRSSVPARRYHERRIMRPARIVVSIPRLTCLNVKAGVLAAAFWPRICREEASEVPVAARWFRGGKRTGFSGMPGPWDCRELRTARR